MAELREIYIFGIVVFYVVFGLLYLASVNTLTLYNPDNGCTADSLTQESWNIPNSIEDKTDGLFNNVFKKINCLPEGYSFVNYVFLILTILIILLTAMLILHG